MKSAQAWVSFSLPLMLAGYSAAQAPRASALQVIAG